jgi:hypothetical protein
MVILSQSIRLRFYHLQSNAEINTPIMTKHNTVVHAYMDLLDTTISNNAIIGVTGWFSTTER